MAREKITVTFCEFARFLARALREFGESRRSRRAENQRPVLGADGVIRGYDAGLAQPRQVLAVEKIQDRVAGAEFDQQTPPSPVSVGIFFAARPAQDWGDLGGRRRPRCGRR